MTDTQRDIGSSCCRGQVTAAKLDTVTRWVLYLVSRHSVNLFRTVCCMNSLRNEGLVNRTSLVRVIKEWPGLLCDALSQHHAPR